MNGKNESLDALLQPDESAVDDLAGALGLSLHHVGYVVAEIPPATATWVRRYGYRVCSPVIHDVRQSAYVQFLRLSSDHIFVEFVAPDGPSSKLTNALTKGRGLHHLCYSVDDIERATEALSDSGMVILCEPVPAVAFAGLRISWLMADDRLPVELVERNKS